MKTRQIFNHIYLKTISDCISVLLLCVLVVSCSGGTKQIFTQGADVGNVLLPGSFTFDAERDVYTLSGSGYDMWFDHDEFFMVWEKVTGDFRLSARVEFEGEGAHDLRKIGLIIRESLEGNARHANAVIHGNALTSLQFRREIGGITYEVRSANLPAPTFTLEVTGPQSNIATTTNRPEFMPDHLILERIGNTIIMKAGVGSHANQPCAVIEIELAETAYVGLFVCSHEIDVLETGRFYDVRLELR